MGVCFWLKPQRDTNSLPLSVVFSEGKGVSESSCNDHLSLTGEEGKHLLVFKGPVWTLRRNLTIFYSSKQDLVLTSLKDPTTIRNDNSDKNQNNN